MEFNFKGFSSNILTWQNEYIPYFTPKKVYFEFGVGIYTLIPYMEAVIEFCAKTQSPISEFVIYAFDSFKGLSESSDIADNHIHWNKGSFVTPRKVIEENMKRIGFPKENVHFIEGYYEKTLDAELLGRLQAGNIIPSFVTIDVDYYSSTKTVMEWLFPLLSSGCIFYFDDIWSFHGHPELGELKYINEFNKSGRGHLVPFTYFGEKIGQTYMFSRKDWEWKNNG